MKKVIHHIRKQPEHIRRIVLHVLIIVIAFVLVSFWVYSLGTNVTSTETQTQINQNLKPFSVLKDNIVNGYNQLQ